VGELAQSFNLMLDRLGSYRDEVENQNRVLESKVSERTADLQEATEQAIQSARQAREASQAKSQFLASMSHELRTPLNGVLGNIDLLQNSDLDARQRRFAESAYRSSEMLLGLVTDILDFSKIEAGKLELESLDFDVRELIEDVVVLMAPRAHVKGLELFCSVGVDVPRNLCGDPGRLRQILVNLVANAIKFTEVGRVVLCVDVEEPGDSEVDLRFEVEDTGIGISAEAQHRLFESFAQADGSTTRKYGGTGLGLAIAKQLSELMGGTIGVESEAGQGSRFWFTAHLELGKSQEPGPEVEGVAERLRELEAGVASASEKLAQHVCDQLDSWGMRASRFESGSQALELLRRRCDSASRLHLLIVDAELPDMSGAELAAAIRSEPRIESTRLILLTPLGARGQVAAHTSAEIDAYVTKPILQSRLYNAVLTVLDLVPSREALATDAPASPGVAGLRVLLVDDNPVNLDLGVAMLQALGCRVGTASSGQEALESFEPGRYDVILMDCQMPGLDGYETTRRIRDLEHRHSDESVGRIPIIAVTANAIEGDRERCLAADMNDYLAKPFVLKQLSATLRRWLETELSPEGAPGSDLPEGDAERELSSALDPEVLDGIRELQQDGASDLLIGVAKTYLESSETLLERLRTAAEALDPVELHQAAHGLKGSSANLGARQLAELCRQVDEYARDDDAESAARLLASLENEYERVRLELASLIAAGA
jgi:signal transduction histidine kinase/CheY-like chemotaxis protein/HPt (histidine-containing phosphotransfer) domain-containing protein